MVRHWQPLRYSIGLITLLLTGCAATFAHYKPPAVPQPSRPLSLAATISTEERMVFGNMTVQTPGPPGIAEEARRALLGSGLFSSVVDQSADSALQGSIEVRISESKMDNAVLALLTAFVLPASNEFRVEVKVHLGDSRSGRAVDATRSDSFRVWYDLFLFPFALTNSPTAIQLRMTRGLTRQAASAALAQLEGPLSNRNLRVTSIR